MQLLTFAHKNEAAAFFHYHQFKAFAHFAELYFDGTHYLLITGEGLWDSLTQCMLAISSLQQQNITISRITNLGVAGALRTNLKKFSTYKIRTSYAALNFQDAEFHSYSSPSINHTLYPHMQVLDCLSFYKRNTTYNEKKILSPFASLIDRELWAIAKAASTLNIPWESIKVISDEYLEENICQLIQQTAHEFSKLLYEQWQHKSERINTNESTNAHVQFLTFLHEKSLYLTFSQKHQVTDLFDRLLAQEKLTFEQFTSEIPFSEWNHERPKENTQNLIQWLKIRLTPQLGQYATQITRWLEVWHNSSLNLQLSVSNDLEALDIRFKSHTLNDWNEILEHLQKIPRHELDNILSGHT